MCVLGVLGHQIKWTVWWFATDPERNTSCRWIDGSSGNSSSAHESKINKIRRWRTKQAGSVGIFIFIFLDAVPYSFVWAYFGLENKLLISSMKLAACPPLLVAVLVRRPHYWCTVFILTSALCSAQSFKKALFSFSDTQGWDVTHSLNMS